MPLVELSWVSWAEFWPEAKSLTQLEYDEHKDLLGLWRAHNVDTANMEKLTLAGILHIAVARVNGVLSGYCMVSVGPDLECTGNMLASQGPFYVKAKRQLVSLGLGAKLLGMCIEKAQILGAHDFDLHHPHAGRGLGLAKFFTYIGAKPMNLTYRLRLEN